MASNRREGILSNFRFDAPQPYVPQSHEMLVKSNATVPSEPAQNSNIEEINLKNLLESADSTLNMHVRPGDVVKVPLAGIVYVVGEVNKPGGFVLQNNESISVLQALALAQGTTHTSAISQALIIRTDPATVGNENRNSREPGQNFCR